MLLQNIINSNSRIPFFKKSMKVMVKEAFEAAELFNKLTNEMIEKNAD